MPESSKPLELTDRHYRVLFEHSPNPTLLIDRQGRYVQANPAALAFLECSAEELLGKSVRDFVPADRDPEHVLTHHEPLWDSGGTIETRYEVNGTLKTLELSINPVELDGRPLVLGVGKDVTETRRTRQKLELQAMVLDQIQDHVTVTDLEGHITYINEVSARALKRTPEELIGKHVGTFGDDPRRGATQEEIVRLTLEEGAWRGEVVNYDAEGNALVMDCRARLVRDAEGRPVGMCGVSTDVTQRKKVEQALRQSEVRFRNIFEGSPIGIALVDVESQVMTQVNPALCEIVGRPADRLVGHTVEEFTHPDDLDDERRQLQELINGRRDNIGIEKRLVRPDGSVCWVSATGGLLPEAADRHHVGIALVEDITRRREVEEQLRQSQKMEAVGQLAGGVAHDFNNQLGGIMGYAEMLASRLEDDRLRRWAENILVCTRRSSDLTRQLLAFARRGQYEHTAVDLHETVAEVSGILQHSIDRRIAIEQHLEASPPYTMGDGGQVQNALLNLALNARDAMPEGGTLTVRTSNAELDDAFCKATTWEIDPGNYVRIEVADTGCGIEPGDLKRIFEPFFTTKQPGSGTGMGLAAVYGTVRQHHGAIFVESRPGRGTTFTLYLPQATDIKPAARPSDDVVVAPATARILVVDDEEMIRNLARELLVELGYRVDLAEDGAAAVEQFRDHHPTIALVLLDMIMPNMDGAETYRTLKDIDPSVRVVLLSGYSVTEKAGKILDQGASGYVQKPFDAAELSKAVAEALAEDPSDETD